MKKKLSIIIPLYNSKKEILKKVKEKIKKEKKKNPSVEVIFIKGSKGLANAYNRGIKKSKGEIIITIHQDCIPLEENSIEKLIKPFENLDVVMTYSWVLDDETKRKYYPYPPDGKFVAYRKKALKKVNLFDEKHFFSGGEDVDIFIKLKKIGKIISVNTGIIHIHEGYLGNINIEKKKQNGSINGALFRIWGIKNPKWLKSLILCFIYPASYGKYFIQAFVNKKQDYRRKE